MSMDLAAGMYITVVKWLNRTDRSYVGSCLKVLAEDYPFVRVRSRVDYVGDVTLNLEEVEVRLLSDEFVQAVINPPQEEEEEPVPGTLHPVYAEETLDEAKNRILQVKEATDHNHQQ